MKTTIILFFSALVAVSGQPLEVATQLSFKPKFVDAETLAKELASKLKDKEVEIAIPNNGATIVISADMRQMVEVVHLIDDLDRSRQCVTSFLKLESMDPAAFVLEVSKRREKFSASFQILPDPRTKKVFVLGETSDQTAIKELINELDK